MKKNQITKSVFAAMSVFAVAAVVVVSCQKKGKEDLRPTTAGALAAPACTDTMSVPVDANGIVTIAKLTANKIWKLNGVSYVAANQTLTIDPGTTIVSGAQKTYNDPTYGPQSIAGVLVVGRGGKLVADGKVDSVIVFTTLRALGCTAGSCDTSGVGPSIVMIGQATTNRTTATRVEGIPQPAGVDITYGSGYTYNNADNSGTLEYVRIEFPGFLLRENNEINGLTLAGVGTGTKISHVQVSYSKDDAFEFFGGTVNCDHLVAIGTDDDDYDFDHGYTGTIDFAIGLKDPGTTHSRSGANSDCNGIESDNDGTGTGALPLTKPVLRHFTLLGYGTNANPTHLLNGNRFRRTSSLDVQYSVIGGFPTGARFESVGGTPTFCNNVVQAYSAGLVGYAQPPFTVCSALGDTLVSSANANIYLQLGPNAFAQPFFTCSGAGSYNPANLVPRSTSPAYGNGTTTYKGAFQPGAALWTATWTKFNAGYCCIN